MEKPKLLIVEDNEDLRTQMRWGLVEHYDIHLAEDRASALAIHARESTPVITLDLGLPPQANGVEEGFRALDELLAQDRRAKVIVITGREEREHALEAIARGAHDYFQKPIDIAELKATLKRAFHVYQLEREHGEAQSLPGGEPFQRMLGTSPAMQAVFAAILKVANADAPVLIVGESGCGKELVAEAIHHQSGRRDKPFVVINCGAIPDNLLESELFGHEKGAFTGAHIQRKGRIELSRGGTLFLDEIGELTLPLQVKMLRFLQEKQIERIGGREPIAVDTRVVAATNIDLRQAMADGRFRDDLFFRLSVVTIAVPPLRERGHDVPLIARSLLARYAEENKKKVGGFTSAALQAIEAHDWPGNVRELENRIKRATIMAEGPSLTPEDLELASAAIKHGGRGLRKAREALEKDLVVRTLARHGGNVSRTASELGVSRPTLYELMERLGIRRN